MKMVWDPRKALYSNFLDEEDEEVQEDEEEKLYNSNLLEPGSMQQRVNDLIKKIVEGVFSEGPGCLAKTVQRHR